MTVVEKVKQKLFSINNIYHETLDEILIFIRL